MPLPGCTLLGYNKGGFFPTYFYFLNQGQFFLLSYFFFLLYHMPTAPVELCPGCLLVSCQEFAWPVPGRVEFPHCSWTHGFFRKLFREDTKQKPSINSVGYQRRFRGNGTTPAIIIHVVTQGQLPSYTTGRALWFLVSKDWLCVPESVPYRLAWPCSLPSGRVLAWFCCWLHLIRLLLKSPMPGFAPWKELLLWNYSHKCAYMSSCFKCTHTSSCFKSARTKRRLNRKYILKPETNKQLFHMWPTSASLHSPGWTFWIWILT